MFVTKYLYDKKLIQPPSWLPMNCCYETQMGSIAYGVKNEDSDEDIYGFCIPPKDYIFSHLAGHIEGFGKQKQRFEQFQQHHIKCDTKTYDISIYNIVKYFQLLMENNPNMIDSIFTTTTSVKHCTRVGHMVRDNRKMFLHKGAWNKFKSYAYSQVHKMKDKNHVGLRELIKFENDHGLSNITTFEEVRQECLKRKLIQ